MFKGFFKQGHKNSRLSNFWYDKQKGWNRFLAIIANTNNFAGYKTLDFFILLVHVAAETFGSRIDTETKLGSQKKKLNSLSWKATFYYQGLHSE